MTSSHDIPTVHARPSSGQAVALVSAVASLLGVMLWGLTIVRSIDNTAASTQSMLHQFIRQQERTYDQINDRVERIDSRVRTLEVKVERNL